MCLSIVLSGCDTGSRWAGYKTDDAPYPDINDVDTSSTACKDRVNDPGLKAQNADAHKLEKDQTKLDAQGKELWKKTFGVTEKDPRK